MPCHPSNHSHFYGYLCKKKCMSSYKFRILIDTESNEDIFRDIIIGRSDNFETFYRAIIAAFEFTGDQLASFYVSNDDWDKGHEIALMDMGLSTELDAPFIMRETPITTIINQEGQKLILVYDFMKMWCFLIELVEVLPEVYLEPELTFSIGVAPAEDSKEIDFNSMMGMGDGTDLGNDFDDIFSDFDDQDEDEDNYESFDNIDDYDF